MDSDEGWAYHCHAIDNRYHFWEF
jgi:hypothetical protein